MFYDFNSASEMLLFFPFWREVALKMSKTTKRNRVDNWNIIILIGRAKKSFPLVGKSEGGEGGGMREIIYGFDDERPTTRKNHLEGCVGDYLYSLSADILYFFVMSLFPEQ